MSYKTKRSYWQRDITRYERGIALCQGIVILGFFSYLFYGSILGMVFMSPYLIWFMKSWEKRCIQRKKAEFQKQFQEAIQSLSTALCVGYSVENAMREVNEDLHRIYHKNERILREFSLMLHQLDMNMGMECIFREFAIRMEDRDVQTFVSVFVMSKQSGGDMIGMIRHTITRMSEKMDVQKEIQVMLSAKRLEFRVMSMIPLGMILYLKLSFPEFMSVLYGNLFGILVMTICLITYAVANEIGHHIIEIEV